MSGYANISAVPDQNILYNAASGLTTSNVVHNQLLNQGAQQDIGLKDMATVGQAGASLLNMPEDQAAAAYGPMRANLQAQGFGKNLPATYPGHAATQAFVQQALSLPDQYKLGIITPPGTQAAINAALGTGTVAAPAATSTGAGTGVAAPATSGTIEPDALARAQAVRDGLIKRGLDVDTATGFAANALHESGANPNVGPGDAGASHGTFQWNADRLARYQAIFGHPPDNAPLDEQLDFVVNELGTTEGAARDRIAAAQGPAGKAAAISQYYLRPKDVQPEMARRSATATQLASQWGGAGTSTAAPVITGDSLASSSGLGGNGVVGDSSAKVLARVQAESRAGKYNGQPVVLSTGASNDPTPNLANVEQQIREAQGGNAGRISVLGVGPAVEAKAPGTNAKLQALATSYGAKFVPLPADQMSPDGVHPTAQGYAALKAAIAPPQGAPGGGGPPGRYQVASNAPVAPPASTAPAAALPRDQAVVQAQRTGQAVPVAGVDGLWALPNGNLSSTPPAATPQAQVQVPQPPPNRVMPGSADGPPAAVQQPPGARTNLPRAADVPTGTNSPQYQQAADLQRRALALEAQVDPTGRLKQLAAGLRQQAQLLLQTDSVVQTQEGQVHTLTGAIDKTAAPLPHYVYDPAQHAYIDTTGTNKPEFEPAQRDSAVAQRDVMELGPLVANGTATPEQVARYNVAATTYQQQTLRENPVTKETVRVNTRELPPGFPQPSGPGTGGAPGGAGGGGGSNVVIPGYSPAQQQVERDPAAYKVAESQYDRDSKEVAAIGDAGRSAQADQIRIKEMQDVLQRFSTGPGTEARTAASAFLQRWLPSALSGWQKTDPNLSGADAAQAFSKLALTGAGSQERGVLGNRGGYQAISLFQKANPNVDLQDATNKSILDMQLISNQANQDYSQAALSHFADNEKKFGATHQYDSLAQFDRNWNAQRNPQVYAAAMGAVNGQPAAQWAKGLSDEEYTRALQIVSRANPAAIINTKSGRYSMQPQAVTNGAQVKPTDTVIRYDHSGNRLP